MASPEPSSRITGAPPLAYETILYEEDGPVGTLTLNRPDDGNMFTAVMCHEVRDCIDAIRRETRTRVLVITGAGDRFFCIGGRKEGMEDTQLYAGVLPTLDMYEAVERLQKPVIASINGYAVGGGNVLQVMCDITIAKESAIFRQVGPMMGSFDAGFGTWYLEDLVGKKKAKEIWFRNPRLSAREALELGMINTILTLHDPEAARDYYAAGLWREETLYTLLAGHAARRPAAFAVRDGRRRLTWAELQTLVDAVAADLDAADLKRGERVAVW